MTTGNRAKTSTPRQIELSCSALAVQPGIEERSMNKPLLFIAAATLMLSALPQAVDAQLLESKSAEKQCDFFEIYRPEGWNIPGRSDAAPKSRRMSLQTSPGGAVKGVFVTEMKANSASTLLLP